ncbi:MAG: hypothetical protein ABI858_04555 [Pseudoxanthomonas sp.]
MDILGFNAQPPCKACLPNRVETLVIFHLYPERGFDGLFLQLLEYVLGPSRTPDQARMFQRAGARYANP